MADVIADQSQDKLEEQLRAYLRAETGSDKFLQQRISKIDDIGFCRGLTAVWLYCNWLSEQPVTGKERDDLVFWQQSIQTITSWDKKRTLSTEEKKIFKRFLSLIEYYQNIDLIQPGVTQTRFSEYFFDSKGRQAELEYSITGFFNESKIKELLLKTVKPGRMVFLSAVGHGMGIYLNKKGEYSFYNANRKKGAVVSSDIEIISKELLKALNEINYPETIALGIQAFNIVDVPILKKSADSNNVPPGTTYSPVNELLQEYALPTQIVFEYKNRSRLAIHLAARQNCVSSLSYWLQAGESMEARDSSGKTPLLIACDKGNVAVVDYLLEQNADVNVKEKLGKTALILAAEEGHSEVVELLLLRDDLDINAIDNRGLSALMQAVSEGHNETVKLLLERNNLDINAVDKDGSSTLMLAVSAARSEAVKLLLKRDDLDINAVDNNGSSALMRAVSEEHNETVKLLLERDDLDINAVGKDSLSALMRAVNERHTEVVELLLSHDGIDINLTTDNGDNALILAVREGHEKVVQILLKNKKIDPTIRTQYGDNLLMLAVQEGHTEVVKILLADGRIDINSKDKQGYTVVRQAVEEGNNAIVKQLLEAGADVNITDHQHISPLIAASINNQAEIVKLLLKKQGVENKKCDSTAWIDLYMKLEQYLAKEEKKDSTLRGISKKKRIDACEQLRQVMVGEESIDSLKATWEVFAENKELKSFYVKFNEVSKIIADKSRQVDSLGVKFISSFLTRIKNLPSQATSDKSTPNNENVKRSKPTGGAR